MIVLAPKNFESNRQVRYDFIEKHRYRYPVVKMCRCLQVSTRSYYDWRNNKHTKHKELSDRIIENIKNSYSNSEKLYGSIRITADLKHTSTPVSRSTVVKYMRLNGIRSVLL